MIVEIEEKDVRHPEGKILLKNGNVLDCYPNGSSPAVSEPAGWEELFYKEAFYLYGHRDAILSDSRMFLTPLPFQNNLAYTGSRGMRDATLGVYLEWWDECEQAVIKKNGQVQALTYFIAGSPLSGGNHCTAITVKGKDKTVRFSPFLPIWSSFMRINNRYAETKQLYQAYTLAETIGKLREQD
jgi:hypothetical protein